MAGGRAGLSQYFGGLPRDITLPEIEIPRSPPPPPSSGGDGASNAQKVPLVNSLDAKVFTRVSNLLQARSGRLPATLHQATDGTNTVWMVNFETDGTYTLPMVKMPVHTNEYTRPPYKQGDKGFVSTADVDTTSMSNLNQQSGPATYARPANLAALVWHPLGNTTFNDVIDKTAHETYGGDGGTITHDGTKKSQVRTHPTNGTSTSSGGDGSGAEGPHKMTTSTSGTSVQTPAVHTVSASNAQLDNSGNFHNTGTTSSNGAIMSATSMSAPSGSFASGSIGGIGFGGADAIMSLLAGALQFNSPTQANQPFSGTDVSGDTVRARKYAQLPTYTVANLFVQLPPSSTLVAARVFVSDALNGAPPWASVVQPTDGGGSTVLPVFCDGGVWKYG